MRINHENELLIGLFVVSGIYQMKVEDNWVISYHKPTFKKPLRPGTWKVRLIHDDNVILGETSFLVVPLAYNKGKAVTLEDSVTLNNGPAAGLYSSDFIIDFDRDANDTSDKIKEFSASSYSTGSKFEQWIDTLVARHWTIKDTCVVGQLTQSCVKLQNCENTEWSSLSPDPKSNVKHLRNNERG